MVYFGKDGDFVVSEFTELGRMLELLHIHHFYSVNELIFPIFSLVDIPVLPLPNLLE